MNTQTQNLKKILRIITIILISSTLLTPLIFSSGMFFPYITGKAFFMRIIILLSSISYTGLILFDKNSRPKKSFMLYSLLGFIFILFLAMLNSINPSRSFWSNFERMEGLVTMLYMAALFIVSASTIKRKEWSYVMGVSLAISLVVGINALGGTDRISGYLGNSSYLGVYAQIHIFLGMLGALMVFRGNREKELMESGEHKSAHKLSSTQFTYIILFVAISVFNAYILYKTGTRGAFVGLVVGLVLSSIYFAWKEKNKAIRFSAVGFLAVIVLSVGLLGIFKQSQFVKGNPLLSRFSALVTTDFKSVLDTQGEARTMIWKMAFKGVEERPILGWGQDNFGYVFAKYYDPHMFSQEQWFDRSHDVFMDWLIAAGVLGLLGYLSLFGSALYFLFAKKSGFTVIEKSIWLGLLAAYFIHNIFVFDNLSSYVLFFFILGYIHDRYTHDKNGPVSHKDMNEEEFNKMILVGVISILLFSYVGYQTILKPYTQNVSLIGLLSKLQTTGVPQDIGKEFKDIFETSPNGQMETFEQMSTILGKVNSAPSVSTTTKQELFSAYQNIVKKYDAEKNQDARFNYFVANTYTNLGLNDQALVYANKAYELSPQKQSFAYVKAVSLVAKGNEDLQVLSVLKKAYDDAPENITAFGYYVGTLSEIAKKNNYPIEQVNYIADTLVQGYVKNNHDIILTKEFWAMFTNKPVKDLLVQRMITELPDQKDKLLEVSK
jgi:O-antigen ligase